MIASSREDIPDIDVGLQTASPLTQVRLVRLVIGVTSDQTCLVLTGRLGALRRAGFLVTLVASPGEFLDSTAVKEGVTVRPLRMERGVSPLRDLWSLFRLLVLLTHCRPDVTDFSTPKAGFLGNLAAWALRVPYRVYTLRGLKLESAAGRKHRVLLWAEQLSAKCAHVVLCNSVSLRNEALRLGIAPESKLRLLGDGSSNGVDSARFSPGESWVRASLGIAPDALVLGFVGRLTNDKGVPELLVAFQAVLREFPECWLLLVGWFDSAEDALGKELRGYIAEHPRIKHVGFVADTAPYYRAMDVMILPTHREGFPNAVLEAAACGVPVITTEVTGARDAVLAEVTGLLIPAREPGAIAQAARDLLRDAEKRKRMGSAAREWVVRSYSQERVLALAVEFYRGMVKGRD